MLCYTQDDNTTEGIEIESFLLLAVVKGKGSLVYLSCGLWLPLVCRVTEHIVVFNMQHEVYDWSTEKEKSECRW